jgi:hypothetical protein
MCVFSNCWQQSSHQSSLHGAGTLMRKGRAAGILGLRPPASTGGHHGAWEGARGHGSPPTPTLSITRFLSKAAQPCIQDRRGGSSSHATWMLFLQDGSPSSSHSGMLPKGNIGELQRPPRMCWSWVQGLS